MPQRHPGRAGQQQRVELRLAMQNAGGYGQRQCDYLALHLGEVLLPLAAKALERGANLLRAPIERRFTLLVGLASGLFQALTALAAQPLDLSRRGGLGRAQPLLQPGNHRSLGGGVSVILGIGVRPVRRRHLQPDPVCRARRAATDIVPGAR